MERDASGHFPPFVVKEVDPALVEKTRPGVSFANVAGVEEGPLTVFLSPNDEPGWVRSEQRSPALMPRSSGTAYGASDFSRGSTAPSSR